MGTKCVPTFGNPHGYGQVQAFLRWSQWLARIAFVDEDVVMLNIDETAVERLIPHRQGNSIVFRPLSVAAAQVYERIARRDSHGHVTLMGCVSSVPELQQWLPQFVLANDGKLSRAEKMRLRALLAPFVWLEGCAGWVNSESFCAILTRLRRAVLRLRPGARLVIACDPASQHTTQQVISHAARLRVQLLFIPGRLTWLMQPLDTHVFGAFKQRLHHVQCSARARSSDGTLPSTAWIDFLETVVREFLVEKSWHTCFHENGLFGIEDALRERIRQAGVISAAIVAAPPTDADLAVILGRRRPGLAARLNRAPSQLLSHDAAPALSEDTPPPGGDGSLVAVAAAPALGHPAPIASRTRSHMSLL